MEPIRSSSVDAVRMPARAILVLLLAAGSGCGHPDEHDAPRPTAQAPKLDTAKPDTTEPERASDPPKPDATKPDAKTQALLARTGLVGRESGAGFGGRGKRVPHIRQAKARIEGAIDPEQLRRAIRKQRAQTRECWTPAMTKCPNLSAYVVLEIEIDPHGKVSAARVLDSTTKFGEVLSCLVKSVKRWRFPKPSDGQPATVTYPFTV